MTLTVFGSVVSLWRYAVKSMLGEELNATEVTKRGLLGDRAYALVDNCASSQFCPALQSTTSEGSRPSDLL